jgi:hypothetical protein
MADCRLGKIHMKSTFLAALAATCLSGYPACAETLKIFIETAEPEFDQFSNAPAIKIQLKPESTAAFEAFTKRRVGEAIEIRFDSKPILEPIIREPIKAGTLMISGHSIDGDMRVVVDGMNRDGAFLEIDGSDK